MTHFSYKGPKSHQNLHTTRPLKKRDNYSPTFGWNSSKRRLESHSISRKTLDLSRVTAIAKGGGSHLHSFTLFSLETQNSPASQKITWNLTKYRRDLSKPKPNKLYRQEYYIASDSSGLTRSRPLNHGRRMRDSPVIRRLVITVTTLGYSKIETASRSNGGASRWWPGGVREEWSGVTKRGSGPNWAPLRSFARAGDPWPNPRVRSVGRGFGEDPTAAKHHSRDEDRRGEERKRRTTEWIQAGG